MNDISTASSENRVSDAPMPSELLSMLEELCAIAGTAAPFSGKRVAIIGSGPAGLAAAAALTKAGHGIEVFEAAPVAGFTLLRVPAQESSSPAPDALVPVDETSLKKAADRLASCGIRFHTSAPQGQSEMEALLASFDAVICACGKAAVLPTDDDGLVKGGNGRLFAAGTCVKNQKVQNAVQAMRSGIKVGGAVSRILI